MRTPPRSLPQFFAENDVAAVRYGPADNPDAVLDEFLRRRLGEGHDALGVLQRRVAHAPSRNRATAIELVPREEWPVVEMPVPPPGAPCAAVLPQLAASLASVLHRRPDVVILNRFGRAECEGAGLLGALAGALDHAIAVLIAPPVALRARWTRVSWGLRVTLRPEAASLEAWWRSLGYGPRIGVARSSLCERAK